MKRVLSYFIGIIASLVLILSIFVLSIDICATDYDFYKEEYNKLSQPKTIGITEEDLMRVTKHLVGYMRGQEADLKISAKIMGKNRQVFAKRDIDHMVDVKNLYVFWLVFSKVGIGFAAFAAFLIILSMRREASKVIARSFLLGTGLFALIGAAIGIWIAVDFTSFWINFHYLFFSNDLWQLDPATSILIQMVPEQFFFDICVKILTLFGVIMSILVALSVGNCIYRSWKRKELLAIRRSEENISEHLAEDVIEKYVQRAPVQSVNEILSGESDFYDETVEDE